MSKGPPGVEVLLSVTELVKDQLETSGCQPFQVCGHIPAANMVRNGVLIFVDLLSISVVSENP